MKFSVKSQNLRFAAPIAGMLMLSVALSGCSNEAEKLRKQNAEMEKSYQAELQERDSLMNEMMATLNEIESNLALVKEKESLLFINKDDQEVQGDRKDKVVRDIQLINSLLEDNKQKMAALEKKLKNSGIQINEFQKRIDALTQEMGQKDQDIAQLKEDLSKKDFELADLNTRLDSVSTQIVLREETITEKDNQINTCYYAMGTRKELQENGVINRDGGVLGMGRTTTVSADANRNYFTRIDLREVQSIPINAKKAKLISHHATDSYELKKENDQIASLQITKPDEFWKASRYLVIEVQ